MLKVLYMLAVVSMLTPCLPMSNNPETSDSRKQAIRIKRQFGWGGYTYKFKTPFYKVKIKTPHPFGGGFGGSPFGGGFGGSPFGPFGFHPAMQMPHFGWYG